MWKIWKYKKCEWCGKWANLDKWNGVCSETCYIGRSIKLRGESLIELLDNLIQHLDDFKKSMNW